MEIENLVEKYQLNNDGNGFEFTISNTVFKTKDFSKITNIPHIIGFLNEVTHIIKLVNDISKIIKIDKIHLETKTLIIKTVTSEVYKVYGLLLQFVLKDEYFNDNSMITLINYLITDKENENNMNEITLIMEYVIHSGLKNMEIKESDIKFLNSKINLSFLDEYGNIVKNEDILNITEIRKLIEDLKNSILQNKLNFKTHLDYNLATMKPIGNA